MFTELSWRKIEFDVSEIWDSFASFYNQWEREREREIDWLIDWFIKALETLKAT